MKWKEFVVLSSLVTSAASGVSSASSLRKMDQQQLQDREVQKFIQSLRNEIFNLRQKAETLLEHESESPLQTTGAMRILNQDVIDSDLIPDDFPELSDKTYVADTFRLIRSNSDRLYNPLTPEQQAQIDQVVTDVKQLPQLTYYLDNAEKVEQLRAAQKTTANASFFGSPGCFPILIYAVILIGSWTCGITFNAIISDYSRVLANLICLIPAVAGTAAVGFLIYRSSGSVREVNAAKKVIRELEPQIDIARFEKIEIVAHTGADIAQMQQKAEARVDSFFGDYDFAGTGSSG